MAETSKGPKAEATFDLTPEQIVEFEEAFRLFDKDGDDKVTADEIQAVMNSVGLSATQEQLKDMIGDLDEDGSGSVDFAEFLLMMTKRRQTKSEEEELREIFKIFDKDGDGYVSASELGYVLSNLGENLTEDEIIDMINEVDVDDDGHVNFSEFAKMMNLGMIKL